MGLTTHGVYTAVHGFGVCDDLSCDDTPPLYFDDYASLLEDKVTEYGGGDAPQDGVTVTPGDTDTRDYAYLSVTGHGTDASFWTHIERTRSEEDDYSPPGLAGGESALRFRGYRIAVTTQKEECRHDGATGKPTDLTTSRRQRPARSSRT